MQAAVLEEVERLVIKEVPEPVCSAKEVLIKVATCAICGTCKSISLWT